MTPRRRPARAAAAPRPVDSSARAVLFGRADDLAALRALLCADERLVTIVGAAGVGKTTLALRLAADRSREVPEAPAPVFCDLSEARDGGEVYAAVAAALGVPAEPRDLAARLGAALAARGAAWIVLDNFEQLVAHAAATVGAWRAAAPDARFVVTSREPLRLRGEYVYPLAPLAVPVAGHDPSGAPAYQLLLDAARRRGVSPAATEADITALAEVARQLDGIPLAIELAAARLPMLPPADLLARLAEPLALLTTGDRGSSSREATLRGAIEWSWRLLTPHEQRALAQLSVFRGGCTLDAAEAVLDLGAGADAPPVLDAVQALQSKSLVRVDRGDADPAGPARVHCLLSVRAFAAEQLGRDPGAAAAAQARHAAHYAAGARAWLARAERGGYRAAVAWAATERDNLLAAADRALACAADSPGAFAQAVAALEAHELLDLGPRDGWAVALPLLARLSAAADAPGVAPGERARARVLFATASWWRDRDPAALAALEAARADADAAGESEASALARTELARAYSQSGDLGRARAAAESVLGDARVPADGHRAALARLWLGHAEYAEGRLDAASAAFRAAQVRLRALGDAGRDAMALGLLGNVALDAGRDAEALAAYDEQLRLARANGYRRIEASALDAIGMVHADAARWDLAAASFDAALAVLKTLGHPALWAATSLALGNVRRAQGRDADAAAWIEQAREVLQATALWYAPLALAAAGALAADRGELVRAAALFDEATARAAGTFDELEAIVALQVGHLDWARARASAAVEEAEPWRAALRARVERVLAPGAGASPDAPALVARSYQARLALRLLERTCGADALGTSSARVVRALAGEAPAGAALLVAADGAWFALPGSEARVELARRPVLRQLLRELSDARCRTPGAVVPTRVLVERVWRGERILPAAARNRLHVAVGALRGLGLRAILVGTRDGYRLDPAVPIRLVTTPA